MTLKTQNALNLKEPKYLAIVSIFYTLLFLSCSNVQERKEPEKILPKDKMVEIYTDMIFLDAAQRSDPGTFKSFDLETSEHIYNKYNIDSITLSQNMAFYNLDFEANTEIYENVKRNIAKRSEIIDSVSKLRDSMKQVKKKIRDSIKKKEKNQKVNSSKR